MVIAPTLAVLPALAVSFAANRALVPFALRLGWCDRPGTDGLKTHARSVPLAGGLGVFVGWAAALLAFSWKTSPAAGDTLTWLAGGLLALGVGMWDDLKWKAAAVPIPKLALQVGVAGLIGLALSAAGVRLVSPPVLGGLLNAGFILGCMNAVNLEDGMDGLAAGEAAIAASGLAVLFLLLGRGWHATVALALAGALVGFLVLNWNPARVFLGDSGSHFTGAALGMLALAAAAGGGPGDCRLAIAELAELAGACLVVGLPVVDTAWVIGRRLAAGRSLVAGDRSHLYDLVHRSGVSTRLTVLLAWLVQAVLVGLGVFLIAGAQR